MLLALACTAMALNPSVLLLPVVIFALRFTGQGMASHVALVAMARWFIATRGRALAIATLGFQAGEAILPLSFVALKRLFAWHDLWLGVAVLVLACIPLLMLLLRQERTPQSMAEFNSAPGMEGRHWTRTQVLRHPLVWRLLPGLAGFSALGTSFWFHQVHYAAEKGWDHLSLVAVFPLGTAAFIASTASYGWALDRVGAARLMPVYLLPLALGFSLLAFAPAVWVAALGVICMGIAGGGQADPARRLLGRILRHAAYRVDQGRHSLGNGAGIGSWPRHIWRADRRRASRCPRSLRALPGSSSRPRR